MGNRKKQQGKDRKTREEIEANLNDYNTYVQQLKEQKLQDADKLPLFEYNQKLKCLVMI